MSILDILAEAKEALSESIYQHSIIVRWSNGDLEGFAGTALSNAKRAKESAEAKANRKAKMIKKDFTILSDKEYAQLDSAQKKRLKRDWELSQRMDESKEDSDQELDASNQNQNIENAQESDLKMLEKMYSEMEEMIENWKKYQTKGKLPVSINLPVLQSTLAKIGASIDSFKKKSKTEAIESEENQETETPEDNDFKSKEKEIAKELVAALSVFLFTAEDVIGHEFESAQEAEEFIFSAFRALKTKEVSVLRAMLNRFNRVGGERMADLFRRSLTKKM